jgi:uncharacterized membrane protein
MIIMLVDHVRSYFHRDAFVYSPTDLSQTSTAVFFTRWITHFCAPVFVFLAGVSGYLYGAGKTRKALSVFLLTRGLWLMFAEWFIVTLEWSFNPSYPFFNLQVIWAIGVSMVVMSALVYLTRRAILLIGIALVAGHNLLDSVHVDGSGLASFIWSLLHDARELSFGRLVVFVHYPVLAWIGIMALGYCTGSLYVQNADTGKRRGMLLIGGFAAITLFIVLRLGNVYGDAAHWSQQKNVLFSFLSFLNTTKYPPSLLYTLMTLGPALIFLSLAENPLPTWTRRIIILGKVPMFYYLLHIFLVHLLAVFAAVLTGYHWQDMILTDRVNRVPELKGYGFPLITVYLVWMLSLLILYPCCKWFSRYKKAHSATQWWLKYL